MTGISRQNVFLSQTVSLSTSSSLSDSVDLGGTALKTIMMSTAWTAASLTFQVSDDNVTFRNLYDHSGTEFTAVTTASRAVRINSDDMCGVRYIKIRSGTSGSAVTQGAARSLTLISRVVQ